MKWNKPIDRNRKLEDNCTVVSFLLQYFYVQTKHRRQKRKVYEAMENRTFEMIKKYAKELSTMESGFWKIMVCLDGQIFETARDCDFSCLTPSDAAVSGEGQEYPAEYRILREENEITAIVLSKTPWCSLTAEKEKPLMPALDDMAQIIGPCAEIVPYEEGALSRALEKASGCFVRDRYTVTGGRNLYEAVISLEVLEKAAEVNQKAEVLGGPAAVSFDEAALMRRNYLENYSKQEVSVKSEEGKAAGNERQKEERKPAESGSLKEARKPGSSQKPEPEKTGPLMPGDREQQIREKLTEFGKKVVESGLVQGTWGNLSMRLDEQYMIVTPSGLDYTRLTRSDMVKVDIETLAYQGSLKPTSEKGIHGGIYSSRTDIGAVIHTHSKYCAVFAAARKNVPIVSEEDRQVFGDEVKLAGYALPGTEELWTNTIEALGQNNGCIMANHGMLCTGKTIEEAFENCMRLENCCRQYIESR